MAKKKILIITQEMKPYTALSVVSEILADLPKEVQSKGYEARILMPKYGTINERRYRLHEVVRLSGMNIIVDDDDYPLIIKVASLPGARLQVYFLDNEDFFKRKYLFRDKNDKLFEDNVDRMVFFSKGVIETVRKFGWPPDIIHCHGMMSSLVPLYLRKAYGNDPLFANSKIVHSAYHYDIEEAFEENFREKALIAHLEEEELESYFVDGKLDLNYGAAHYADGLININKSLNTDALKENVEIPIKEQNIEDDTDILFDQYFDLYSSLVENNEEEE